MNLRAQPPRRNCARRAGFALLLLPVSAGLAAVVARPGPVGEIESRPYLAMVSAPALRFEERIPPPDLSAHPPAAAPPQPLAPAGGPAPTGKPVQAVVPRASAEEPTATPSEVQKSSSGVSEPASGAPTPTPPAKPPDAILPDDTRPRVRAEDFLPFFRFPGASARADEVNLTPTPPAPGQQPPSSATYRQQ